MEEIALRGFDADVCTWNILEVLWYLKRLYWTLIVFLRSSFDQIIWHLGSRRATETLRYAVRRARTWETGRVKFRTFAYVWACSSSCRETKLRSVYQGGECLESGRYISPSRVWAKDQVFVSSLTHYGGFRVTQKTTGRKTLDRYHQFLYCRSRTASIFVFAGKYLMQNWFNPLSPEI